MTRCDAAPFNSADATDALHAVRYALALILGRRSDVVLPVGWHHDQPVWARWTAGRVDSYSDPGNWLDTSIAATQAAETISRFLSCWADPLRRDTLLYATSYYTQAPTQGAELALAAAVSGLLLIGSSWLVEENRLYSRTTWKKMNTEPQIRALLDYSECRINPALPRDFVYLQQVAHQIRADGKPSWDGLSCMIKMRNDVIHPTRETRGKWSYEQKVEAYIFALHLLELATLAYIRLPTALSPANYR